jgi:hypothetical protein
MLTLNLPWEGMRHFNYKFLVARFFYTTALSNSWTRLREFYLSRLLSAALAFCLMLF